MITGDPGLAAAGVVYILRHPDDRLAGVGGGRVGVGHRGEAEE